MRKTCEKRHFKSNEKSMKKLDLRLKILFVFTMFGFISPDKPFMNIFLNEYMDFLFKYSFPMLCVHNVSIFYLVHLQHVAQEKGKKKMIK